MLFAGDNYNQLAIREDINIFSDLFCDMLLERMINDSFSPQSENVMKKLRECLPIFCDRLRDSPSSMNHSLKLAEDVAKNVGYYEIHGSKREDETRLMFEAALTLILYIGICRGVYNRPLLTLYSNYAEFKIDYDVNTPGFNDSTIDPFEEAKLVHFANFMKTILLLVPNPKGKRAHLLDIVTRLSEGKHKKYITGTGQSNATLRRVQIYQKESGVFPTARPPRFKEIAEIILDENVTSSEVTKHMADIINEQSTEPTFMKSYSFPHPSQPGIQIEAVEVLAQHGANLLRSVAMTRGQEDGTRYDVSRSVSLSTFMPTESCNIETNDMLRSFDEVYAEPLATGIKRHDETSQEKEGTYREVSLSKIFSTNESDQIEPDYYSWLSLVDVKTKSGDLKVRSLSQIINFGPVDSSSSRADDALRGSPGEGTIPLKSGTANVSLMTYSFNATTDDLALRTFGGSWPILGMPETFFGDSISVEQGNSDSRVRPREDTAEVQRKIPRTAWDSLLDL